MYGKGSSQELPLVSYLSLQWKVFMLLGVGECLASSVSAIDVLIHENMKFDNVYYGIDCLHFTGCLSLHSYVWNCTFSVYNSTGVCNFVYVSLIPKNSYVRLARWQKDVFCVWGTSRHWLAPILVKRWTFMRIICIHLLSVCLCVCVLQLLFCSDPAASSKVDVICHLHHILLPVLEIRRSISYSQC